MFYVNTCFRGSRQLWPLSNLLVIWSSILPLLPSFTMSFNMHYFSSWSLSLFRENESVPFHLLKSLFAELSRTDKAHFTSGFEPVHSNPRFIDVASSPTSCSYANIDHENGRNAAGQSVSFDTSPSCSRLIRCLVLF